MTFDSVYPTLKLFIDKSRKLENSRFVKSISQEFRIDLKLKSGSPINIKSIRPDQDNIDAFVLTFRFFIQDNEPISIRNMRKIFSSELVTEEEKNNFNKLRENIDHFLSGSSHLVMFEEEFTHGELMDIFIYGGISHATEGKKQKFDSLMVREDVSEFFWHKFIIVISFMLQSILYIRDMLLRITDRNKYTTNSNT